jgi:hypothetical protein
MQTNLLAARLDAAMVLPESTAVTVANPISVISALNNDVAEVRNPQPLRPAHGLNEDLIASLPPSRLAGLEPQPVPTYGLLGDLDQRFAPSSKQAFKSWGLQHANLNDGIALSNGEIDVVGPARGRPSLNSIIAGSPLLGTTRHVGDQVLPLGIGGIFGRPEIQGPKRNGHNDALTSIHGSNRPPLFAWGKGDVHEVSINDIHQNKLGDCFFLGALASVAAQDPQRIKHMVVDNGDGTYTVTFKERSISAFGPEEFHDRQITVTLDDLPGGMNGQEHVSPGDAKYGQAEIWPIVLDKAYGQYLNEKDPYGTLDKGGQSRFALEAITGRPAHFSFDGHGLMSDTGQGFDHLLSDFQAGKSITVGTGKDEKTLVPNHCYAVKDVYVDENGRRWVELYNPWGTDHATLPYEEVSQRSIWAA